MANVVVPEGHRIEVVLASPLPRVTVGISGACVAQLGTASDDAEAELARVVAELDALTLGRVVVANVGGDLQQLFQPNNPTVLPVQNLILWVVDAERLGAQPALAGAFMDQLRTRDTPQTVFVREAESVLARAVIPAIQANGVNVRVLEAPDYPVLIEVARPELTLCSLAGVGLPQLPLGGLPGGAQPSVSRAPRLRRLILAGAREPLEAELRTRELPLLAFAHPTGAMQLRNLPNGRSALPVYADRASVVTAAKEMGMGERYSVVEMVPSALFDLAIEKRLAIALCAFDDQLRPVFVAIETA